MGKKSRKGQSNEHGGKECVSADDRKSLVSITLNKLAENGLTVANVPELRSLLSRLKEYSRDGERLECTIDIEAAKCRLVLVLPKYATERPRIGLYPQSGTT